MRSPPRHPVSRCLCGALPLVASLATAGCAVHSPGFDAPVAAPGEFAPDEETHDFAAEVPDRWWQSFEDPALETLVQRALDDNFDLATFRSRLRAASAIVDRADTLLLPFVDYSLFGQQTRRESQGYDPTNQLGASLTAGYQLDLWRQNRSTIDSAVFQRELAREELAAAAISLSSQVAATWFTLLEQRAQARVLDAQITNNEKVLRVVRTRFGGGAVRASDVLRQQRLLESTREQRAVVRASVATLEHALLVLTGRVPTDPLGLDGDDLPDLPPAPALGLPSELVQRRPDVRAAWFAIRAADAEVAVAVAAKYPSVTLGASASTVGESLDDLAQDWTSLIGIDVLGPLFDAGLREAEVQRNLAVKDQRILEYAQTVLRSFREVVDALARESAFTSQIERIETQLRLAGRTSERLNREYLNGDISYIDVLQALTTEQRLQRDLLSARRNRILNRVDLYVALAGGWPGLRGAPAEAAAEGRP